MSEYIIKQTFSTLPVLVLVSFIAFSLMHLVPGDPVLALLPEDAPQEQVDALRHSLGYDQPMLVQYWNWAKGVLRLDFGRSVRTGQPVGDAMLARLKPTLQLNLLGLAFASIIGVPLGILSAARRNSLLDNACTVLAMAGIASPNFWRGILMMLVFSVWLNVLPPMGYVDPSIDLAENLRRMVLPVLTLGTGLLASIVRQTRSSMLDVLQEDYIRTARSKGLQEKVVLLRHALGNAMLPVLTTIGSSMGRLVGGAVVTEFVFGIPGMGRMALDSVFTRDYPAVQGVSFVMAAGVLLTYLLVDISYAVFDPRIRYN